jgi:hypothetical protein
MSEFDKLSEILGARALRRQAEKDKAAAAAAVQKSWAAKMRARFEEVTKPAITDAIADVREKIQPYGLDLAIPSNFALGNSFNLDFLEAGQRFRNLTAMLEVTFRGDVVLRCERLTPPFLEEVKADQISRASIRDLIAHFLNTVIAFYR